MEAHARSFSSATPPSEEERDLRRGPWTVEEDLMLMNYIAVNGDGRWNYLAQSAGLRRTGKSCRLRWLNYLCPDVRRGNITPEEQLLILDLHSRWGNRWSKIAKYLPGRTDNEIKNYWRTRVQKHAKHLRCDVDSKQFQDLIRYLWKPRLVEKIRAAASSGRELGQVDPSTGSWSTAASSPGSVGLEGCDMPGGDGRDGEGIQATQFVGSADRGLPDSDFASWGENLLWGGDEIWLQ